MDFFVAGGCFPRNLTLNFTAERCAPLSQALSAWDVVPAPTVSHVWVNPPSQPASFVGLAASVGSVGMDLPVG
jgi:hypothetical protein